LVFASGQKTNHKNYFTGITITISTHIHFNSLLEMINDKDIDFTTWSLSARNDHHLDLHSMPTSYVSTFDHMHLPPPPAITKLTLATKPHFKCITPFVHLLCLHDINLPFFYTLFGTFHSYKSHASIYVGYDSNRIRIQFILLPTKHYLGPYLIILHYFDLIYQTLGLGWWLFFRIQITVHK